MAVEALFDQVFTTQSDVWAYGILLWDLVTLGGTPYPTIKNRDLLKLLKDDYRMEKPEVCSDEIYNIMTKSWEANPEDRPTLFEIRELIEGMISDNPYLDLNSLDETKDYYNIPSFNSIEDEPNEFELMPSQDENVETCRTNAALDSGIHDNSDAVTKEWKDVFELLEKTTDSILDFEAMQARIYRKTSSAVC